MGTQFSIKDLEKISGIKAHTLRIWEQRYGILKPTRTDTNIRCYCNEELKNILNVSLLNNNGYKISKIATLSKAQIADEVNKIVNSDTPDSEQIEGLIISMVDMDELRFEKIISNNILRTGFSHTIEAVIYPFLHKIGLMWQTGSINPAQEHFISNLIRQKLIVAIDGVIVPENKKQKKFILFLPDGELHEVSLLYFTYLIKSKGHQVIYLGQSVPFIDLQRVYSIREPHYIVSVFTRAMDTPQNYVTELSTTFPKSKILLSGYQVIEKNIVTPKNINIFKTPSDLLSIIS